MKFTLVALVGAAATANAAGYQRLNLPDPQNWIAASSLFPGDVIAGYNADYNKYDKESWANYILDQCKGFSACTSTISYSGKGLLILCPEVLY